MICFVSMRSWWQSMTYSLSYCTIPASQAVIPVTNGKHEHIIWHIRNTYAVKDTSQWWLKIAITLSLRNNPLFIFVSAIKSNMTTAPYILVKIQKLFQEYFPICCKNFWSTYLLHGTTTRSHSFAWTHMFYYCGLVDNRMASMNWVSIGSGIGLSPVQCQFVTYTNTDMSIWPFNNFRWH